MTLPDRRAGSVVKALTAQASRLGAAAQAGGRRATCACGAQRQRRRARQESEGGVGQTIAGNAKRPGAKFPGAALFRSLPGLALPGTALTSTVYGLSPISSSLSVIVMVSLPFVRGA